MQLESVVGSEADVGSQSYLMRCCGVARFDGLGGSTESGLDDRNDMYVLCTRDLAEVDATCQCLTSKSY